MVRSKPLTQEKKPVPKARIFFLFFIFYNLPSHLTRTSPKPTPIQVCNPSIRTGTAWKPGIGVLRTKTSFTKSSFANPKTAPTPRKKKKKKKGTSAGPHLRATPQHLPAAPRRPPTRSDLLPSRYARAGATERRPPQPTKTTSAGHARAWLFKSVRPADSTRAQGI